MTYVAGVKAAKTWLKTQAAHVDLPDMANPPAVTREDLLNFMHLPKVELDKFEGNPLEYLTYLDHNNLFWMSHIESIFKTC